MKNNSYVAKVDNEKISTDEFIEQINLERSGIYSYFKEKYDVNNNPNFWKSTYGGESPAKKIKKVALEKCKRIKIQQILAKKQGLVKNINYSNFINQFKSENKQRYEDNKKGKAIYGPVNYDINSYFNDYFNKMVINLKNQLVCDNCIKFSDDDLKKYYDSIKENYYKENNNIVIEKIVLQYYDTNGNIDYQKKYDMLLKAQMIKEKIFSGESFEKLADMYNTDDKLKNNYNKQMFNDNTLKNESLYDNTLETVAKNLKKGQVYNNIIDAGNCYNIIKCIDNNDCQYMPFDDVKEDIKQKYIDKEYNEMIEKIEKSSKLTINKKVYNWVKIE